MSPPVAEVEEARQDTPHGAILFDRRRLRQASADVLDPRHWQSAGGAPLRGGRGSVWLVRGEFGDGVLRHYRRGGVVGRLNRDRYLWAGENATRAFREFRLLAEMRRRELPVPAPLAAGYRRDGLWYRADLLIERVPDTRTLAQALHDVLADADALQQLGTTLARFHRAGVWHADLNAHNLLFDGERRWWVIDFDRGLLRVPAARWQQTRLQRLHRSLRKLGAADHARWPHAWSTLQEAHDRAVQAAA